jgi:hypothetical protein
MPVRSTIVPGLTFTNLIAVKVGKMGATDSRAERNDGAMRTRSHDLKDFFASLGTQACSGSTKSRCRRHG